MYVCMCVFFTCIDLSRENVHAAKFKSKIQSKFGKISSHSVISVISSTGKSVKSVIAKSKK